MFVSLSLSLSLSLRLCVEAAQPAERYFSPDGAGDGTAGNPTNYTTEVMAAWVNSTNFPDGVIIHFAPGTYATKQVLITNTNATLLRIQGDGFAEAADLKRAEVTLKFATNACSAGGQSHWILRSAADSQGNPFPSKRIEVADLTLDCNWSNLVDRTRPIDLAGYKNGGINVCSTNAIIQNVAIKNFGANGMVPLPHYWPQGTEAFALLVSTGDYGQSGEGSDAPVVVENCEVSDFIGLHGGYCTGIMICRAGTNWGDRTSPLAVVRHCQVRNLPGGIGLGAAQTECVTFHDNDVLNCSYGFNSDTPWLRNIVIESSRFYDVCSGMHIGGPYCQNQFTDYTIRWNSIRLTGRPLHRLYQDYKTVNGVEQTDVTLDLGRTGTNVSSVVCLQGGTDVINIHDNKATTWDKAYFYPGGDEATWRFVRVLDSAFVLLGSFGPYTRVPDVYNDHQPPEVRTGNQISAFPSDFGFYTDVPEGPDGADRPALIEPEDPEPPFRYSPRNTLVRVQPLGGGFVREPAFGEPATTNNLVTLRVRWWTQPNYGAGPPTTVHFTILSGPNCGIFGWAYTVDGIATWAYTNSGGAGQDVVVAYVKNSGDAGGDYRPDTDYSVITKIDHHPTLTIDAPLDAANDKYTSRKGKVTFTRTGGTNSALTVGFALTNAWGRSANHAADFRFWASNQFQLGTNVSGGTITIPAGATNAVLEVRPVADSLKEGEGVRLLVTNTSPTAAVLPPNDVTVAISDGPPYSVDELPGHSTPDAWYAYAVNNVTNSSGPDIVGCENHQPVLGLRWYRYYGGAWQYSQLTPPSGYIDLVPYGVSDSQYIAGRATPLSGGPSMAFRYLGSATILSNLYGNTEALAVSPSNSPTYIVGYSYNSSGVPRAARWRSNNSWGVEDIGALYSDPSMDSYAYAVNSSGRVVGKSRFSTNSTAYHAFRTAGGAGVIVPTASDLLTLFNATGYSSSGNAINAAAVVAGGSDNWVYCRQDGRYEPQYRACSWSASGSPSDLGVLQKDTSDWGNLSEGLGINDSGVIVGYSRTTHTGEEHAFIMDMGKMVDLNDKHMVYRDNYWTFVRAEAINNQGYIVGWGYHNGYTRAFVLMPNQ